MSNEHDWHRVLSRDDGAPDIVTTNQRCKHCTIRANDAWNHWPAVKASECVAALHESERVELPGEIETDGIENWGSAARARCFAVRINCLIAYLEQEQKGKEALPGKLDAVCIHKKVIENSVQNNRRVINQILRYLKGGEW